MRRVFLLSALLTAAFSSYGQGQVNFNNVPANSLTAISTNSVPGGSASGLISGPVGSYYFGLFVAPMGTTDTNAFIFSGLYGTNRTIPGTFQGGQPTIAGYPVGSTASFLVRGWSGNIGHD